MGWQKGNDSLIGKRWPARSGFAGGLSRLGHSCCGRRGRRGRGGEHGHSAGPRRKSDGKKSWRWRNAHFGIMVPNEAICTNFHTGRPSSGGTTRQSPLRGGGGCLSFGIGIFANPLGREPSGRPNRLTPFPPRRRQVWKSDESSGPPHSFGSSLAHSGNSASGLRSTDRLPNARGGRPMAESIPWRRGRTNRETFFAFPKAEKTNLK